MEADGDASVARDIYHVYDSEDAITSDDEYHEARAALRSYGEGKRRKVNARLVPDGEEVDQLEEFEDDATDVDEDEGDDAAPQPPHNSQHSTSHPASEAPPQQPQQDHRETSQHSSYRGSEESLHVRPNLSDEAGGDLNDGAPHYDPTCDHKALRFVCKMKFANMVQFKDAVVRHAVAAGACLRWLRSNPTRREVRCKDPNCKWKLYASWFRRNKCFMIRKVGLDHSCARSLRVNQITANWIASDMLERFRINPTWAPDQIMAEIKLKHNMDVKKRTCYRAKVAAIKLLSGSLVDEYKGLRSYVSELMKRDPDGRFVLEVDPHPDGDKCYFRSLFIGFSCLRDGFLLSCRPMFGLDGCFLKGEVKGMLLSAAGKDGNNQMFPIVWAVVEGENTSSWMWFVQLVTQELSMRDGRGWTVISDQQKGLVESLREVLPEAEHRKCARHVYANWKAKNKTDRVRKLFWKAVYACNEPDWKKATCEMEEIQGNGSDSTPYTDFMAAEPTKFCRAFLSTVPKCDSVESNICETWNGSIVKYRGFRIIDMLEGIRGYMMVRVVIKHKMLMDTTDELCPRIRKRLEKDKEFARLCVSRQSLHDKCEVKMGGEGYIVDLSAKECTCGYWQLSGIPCCHAISAISHLRKNPDDFVHPLYRAMYVSEGYKVGLPCLDGRQAWPTAQGYEVHPPKARAMPGRPKKTKKKSAAELETRPQRGGVGEEVCRRGNLIRCSNCGGEGHNARSCKAPPAVREERVNNSSQRGKRAAVQEADVDVRSKRAKHCSKCGRPDHSMRTCPLNRGLGIQDVRLNVGDRATIAREIRREAAGVGVYVDETTGNQYVRMNGDRGRPHGEQPTVPLAQASVVDLHGSQPPPTQP
ncbi:unnamed protein product [Linum trigynum]